MKFSDINPYIRFAETVKFSSEGNWAYVQDCRLIYVLSGFVNIDIDKNHYHLNPGALFYCCRGQVYSHASPGTLFIAINFDLDRTTPGGKPFYPRINVPSPDTPSPFDSYHIKDSDFINSHLVLQNGTTYFSALNSIVDEFSACRPFYLEKVRAILKNILIDLHRQTLSADLKPSRIVQQIQDYIHSHFDQPVSNQSLAEQFGYHPHYLNRMFTKQTGKSIHQYLLAIRLTEAQRMLLATDLSLADIAERTGFCSYSHFSSYFKRETGLSPLAYRSNRDNL